MVSRDSIRIIFLLASLHVDDSTDIDVDNTYLNEAYMEKIRFVGGNECREDKGSFLLIFCALYGLKSAFSLWRSTLASALR